MICVVAAAAKNRVIGRSGGIPWDIPEDRAYFKALTTGGAVIMGRKTFESIGRPLPKRLNIVISGSKTFNGRMLRTAQSLPEAVRIAERYSHRKPLTGIFICGGAAVYEEGLEIADRVCLTELYDEYEGDVFFPELPERFRLVSCDDRPELRLRFCVYDSEVSSD